jgi:HK97 family phage major capsid protein
MTDVDKLGARIEREEQVERLESSLSNDNEQRQRDDITRQRDEPRGLESRESKEYREAFARFLVGGVNSLTADEYRAMQADSDTGGGFLVAPQQMVTELLKAVDDVVIMRQFARKFPLTKSASLGVPTLDTDAADADWTAELATGDETELGFGKRELRPHPLSKLVKLSNKLIRIAALNPEQLVNERLAHLFGITQEKAFMTGDGLQKPLGVFTASADGINTGRDVSDGNTATLIKADALINAKYALKAQYHPRARWIMHRDVMAAIRKLKDGNGQYLWQPAISGGVPDRILEQPYILSEYAPNTFESGKYLAILGDFQFYWIADALDMQIQRLSELYARANQTGFIGRLETDGMPILEEAFIRLKLA